MLKYRKWLLLRNKCFIKPWMIRIQCWQGKFTIKVKIIFWIEYENYFLNCTTFSADSGYCWAFSISSMIRHSLNMFLREQKKKAADKENHADKKSYRQIEKINQEINRITLAEKYLNGSEFHKRLRNWFEAPKYTKSFKWKFVIFLVDFLSKL